jgi:hypothetical protein
MMKEQIKTDIKKPEDHDWTGKLCMFKALIEDGAPVIDPATGRITPGLVKARGTVLGQTYLGRVGLGMIPDFEIEVQCKSGVYKIGLLDNGFQPVL